MAENTTQKTTKTTKTVRRAVDTAFAVEENYAKYCETRLETQVVDLFKAGKSPTRINSDDCAGDRRAYRTVIAEKIGALAASRHAYTWNVSKVLYDVCKDAYKTKAPWKVTEVLTDL